MWADLVFFWGHIMGAFDSGFLWMTGVGFWCLGAFCAVWVTILSYGLFWWGVYLVKSTWKRVFK